MRVEPPTRDTAPRRCDTTRTATTSPSPSPRKCVLPQSVLTHTNAHTNIIVIYYLNTEAYSHRHTLFSVCVASQIERGVHGGIDNRVLRSIIYDGGKEQCPMVSVAQHGSHHLLPGTIDNIDSVTYIIYAGTHDPRGRTDCVSIILSSCQCVTNIQLCVLHLLIHCLWLYQQPNFKNMCCPTISYYRGCIFQLIVIWV